MIVFFQVSKIIGAASEADSSFNKLGQAISAAIEAMARTLAGHGQTGTCLPALVATFIYQYPGLV